jgi:hypothetical protein
MNVLFVSIAFPPKNDPEAIQTGRIFKWLVKDDSLRIDVVTSKNPTLFMPVDPTLEENARGLRQLIEVPIFENRWVNKAIWMLYPNLMFYPDSKASFALQSSSVIKKLQCKPGIIYSRSFPISSALMAEKLAAHYNVPWIMHLSDPWVDSALHQYKGKILSWNSKKEAALFTKAAALTLTSPKTVALYASKYPHLEHKMHLMPNVYDDEAIEYPKGNINNGTEKIKFIYAGGLANTRDAIPLLKAIQCLGQMHPAIIDKVEFIFAGPMDRRNSSLFKEFAHPSIICMGVLPASEAKELLSQADILLLFDSRIQNAKLNVFFPSKLLDYALAGKPVLAITGVESYSREFIHQLSIGECFDFDDVGGIVQHIVDVVEGKLQFDPNLDELSTFSASYNAKRLSDLMSTLIQKHESTL